MINLIQKDNSICLNNPDYFMVFSDFTISDGIDIVENINIIDGDIETLNDGSYITEYLKDFEYFKESHEDIEIYTFISNDVEIQDFTENLKVANSKKGFDKAEINISHIIQINKELSPKTLLEIYKEVITAKTSYFSNLHLPQHIQDILNKNTFLAIATKVPEESLDIYEDSVDIINNQYTEDVNMEIIRKVTEDSCKKAFQDLDFGILDYLVAEGITIQSLIDAGMELLVGIDETQEIREKLEKQILKSLEDINVIALLMAAIRTEEDFSGDRIREVDVSDDPAYLYTDEVLGLAISNQIAGTKATFNFKRYDEEKPGILSLLGPMIDDIIGGLIAGNMSKIFEE